MNKLWVSLALLLLGVATSWGQPLPASSERSGYKNQPVTAVHTAADGGPLLTAEIAPAPVNNPLDKQVKVWVDTLAKEKGFEAWSGAKWDIYPLGPGTRSWLVLISAGGKEAGYLIVGSTDDGGFALTEYGAGENPLFSLHTLHESLMRQGLLPSDMPFEDFLKSIRAEKNYSGGLEAYWKVDLLNQSTYIDAKTGERLPNLTGFSPTEPALTPRPQIAAASSGIAERLQLPGFDPFLKASWLKSAPAAITGADDLKAFLKKNPKTAYTAKIFAKKAFFALPITGYQDWRNGRLYVSLDEAGSRFISLDWLLQNGGFYPN